MSLSIKKMRAYNVVLLLIALGFVSACQTAKALNCVAGECERINTSKRAALQAEQAKNRQLQSDQTQIKAEQKNVRAKLTSIQKEYRALSASIGSMQEDLKKAGKQDSELSEELIELQRDLNLRRSMTITSSISVQEKELERLRKREKSLKKQIKVLLANS